MLNNATISELAKVKVFRVAFYVPACGCLFDLARDEHAICLESL